MRRKEVAATLDAHGLRIGVAVSTFNAPITEGLLRGALQVLEAAGAEEVTVVRVPGSFELPLAAQALVEAGCRAVVALGAVIEGETDHYQLVTAQAAAGLQEVMLRTGVPVGFGVLATRKASQARARSAADDSNRGAEAARAAVLTASVLAQLGEPRGEGYSGTNR
ncbi:MAG: 6,7-dimethyl-8-ribityllumazine synthase [Acidimicrobiia bacterium]